MKFQLKSDTKVGRNDLCPCGSGLKHKYCHADHLKQAIIEDIARKTMAQLIFAERIKRKLICKHGIPANKKCIDCESPQELEVN